MGKTNETLAYLSFQKKLVFLKHVKEFKSITRALKEFRIPKSTYYKWKKAFDKDGENGLLRKHPF
jgi:transposase